VHFLHLGRFPLTISNHDHNVIALFLLFSVVIAPQPFEGMANREKGRREEGVRVRVRVRDKSGEAGKEKGEGIRNILSCLYIAVLLYFYANVFVIHCIY